MTDPVQKTRVPPKIRALIGRNKAYVVTESDNPDGEYGYYYAKNGRILHGLIPKYVKNGRGYTNLTDKVRAKDISEVENPPETEESTESEPKSEPKKKPKAKKEPETEEKPAEPTVPTPEESATPEVPAESTEGTENDPETAVPPVPEDVPVEDIEPTTETPGPMTPPIEEEPDEFMDRIKSNVDIDPESDINAPDDTKEEHKKWFNWGAFAKAMKSLTSGFQDIMKFCQKCMADAGADTFSKAVSSIAVQPILTRTYNVNDRINTMFRNAGVKGDIGKWIDDHKNTAAGKLLMKKTNAVLTGSTMGMDNLQSDMFDVVREFNPGATRESAYLDTVAWDNDKLEKLRVKTFDRAKKLEDDLRKDPSDVRASAEYRVYYDALQGLNEGKNALNTLLKSRHSYQIIRQSLIRNGLSEQDADERMKFMEELAKANGVEMDKSEIDLSGKPKSPVKPKTGPAGKPDSFSRKGNGFKPRFVNTTKSVSRLMVRDVERWQEWM